MGPGGRNKEFMNDFWAMSTYSCCSAVAAAECTTICDMSGRQGSNDPESVVESRFNFGGKWGRFDACDMLVGLLGCLSCILAHVNDLDAFYKISIQLLGRE